MKLSAAVLAFSVLILSAHSGPLDKGPVFDEDPYHPSFPEHENVRPKSRKAELEQTIQYWRDNARQTVETIAKRQHNKNTAKNVILFLGDGMSIATVALARVYAGGEEKKLSFEEFPYLGMSKTYCVDYQVADSACSATAYLTGVKGNYETIGVNGQVTSYHCTADMEPSSHTHSIAKWAMDAGKDAGFVTTTRVTHASPAGVYAHTANRDWEDDIFQRESGCDSDMLQDIAEQLVHGDTGKRLKVIMGGGRRHFLDNTMMDEEYGTQGYRGDGKNLIQDWLDLAEQGEKREYVWTKQAMENVDPNQTDKLLALFEPSHCAFNLDRVHKNLVNEPTLAEMVDKATDILSKNENGFFLFVEGGRIDHGHHDNWAKHALDETVEFAKAVELARAKFSEEDTLIVVTSDHSHAVSYNGYATRGNNIFGTTGSADDGKPMMTISYANGPGFWTHVNQAVGRVDVRTLDTSPDDFRFPATVPVDAETHGGEDVTVYASGPWSHLFTGTYEQNTIPHIMAYAACIGDGLKACSP